MKDYKRIKVTDLKPGDTIVVTCEEVTVVKTESLDECNLPAITVHYKTEHGRSGQVAYTATSKLLVRKKR